MLSKANENLRDLSGRLGCCPRCGSPWKAATAINGSESEFWKECSGSTCNTWYNTYAPQPHQAAFHSDPHTFKGNFGGYGSGKTLTSREEFYKHMFLTPKGNTLIGANVSSQYDQTIRREIESDLPAAFVKRVNTQKSWIDFNNDHRLLYRPFDDPDKLRSYNLTMFVIIEASETSPEVFTQLKTRLRNLKAAIPARDEKGEIIYRDIATQEGSVQVPQVGASWLEGIIESNPKDAWIKQDVLLCAETISTYGEVHETYQVDEGRKDRAISAHVTATSANAYLPEEFIENNSRNKPPWWVSRYIYGSFMYSEGLVYPDAKDAFIDGFEIPAGWKRAISHDYGLSDPSVFLFLAMDERNGMVYVYKEVRTNEKSVEELASVYRKHTEDIPSGLLAFPPILDPKSGFKRDFNKKTLANLYLDYGIYFEPGFVNLDARIARLNTYLISGRMKIFKEACPYIKDEFTEYKFAEDRNTYSGYGPKPVDRKNHSINALEWLAMRLPADPANLIYGVYDETGKRITEKQDDEKLLRVHALSDIAEKDYETPGSEREDSLFASCW